ncbi:dimethylaniline monooxygenase [N-oxide-forming] 2-like [Saccostrea echinata]|uniref:dimethylaniline monooxygenase [N-oxide-forming] 2-like n=1 Tax=Saccostrea echinata TaxID=191078 RepID=UPI002A8209C9|nr:dimethylaniline monooxygenase [N-oxide-forming] 2-like [Saccostrea echinata]
MTKTVCILGAGVSGLTSIKSCLEEGLLPVCFEKDANIGGLWNYKDIPKDGEPSLYKSCSANTSKEIMCFSDFPVPKEFPNFMNHVYLKKYLDLYAEKFDLRKYIKFQHSIERIQKAEDFSESGDWLITSISLRTGKKETTRMNFVLACNGHLHEPNIPKFLGLERFKGKVIHTHDYKDFYGYEGKRILLIGNGNSGMDVASELSLHAGHFYMSTRKGFYVFQRTYHEGRPFDHTILCRFRQHIPWSLMRPFMYHRIFDRYNHDKYGLSPNQRYNGGTVSITDDLPNRIIYGKITMKTGVERFTENGAIFIDGTELKDIDVIVLATGYKYSYDFLEEGVVKLHDAFPYLYDLVWPVDLQPATLAVIGLVQPVGPVPPTVEMQARWATRVFSEKCQLPSVATRVAEVDQKYVLSKRRFGIESSRYTIIVHYIPYMDKIAGCIGCKPPLWRLFFSDNALWRKIYFWGTTPPQWRLHGPGKWEGAQDAILRVEENTWYPLRSRQAGTNSKEGIYEGWISLLKKLILGLLLLIFLIYIV